MSFKFISSFQISKERRSKLRRYIIGAVILSGTAGSIYIRKWREEHIDDLLDAGACGVFYIKNGKIPHNGVAKMQNENKTPRIRRDLNVLATTVARAGLMGNLVRNAKSVKDELNAIRSWHQQRGFNGGLVLREVARPIYNSALEPYFLDSEDDNQNEITEPISTDDDTLLLSPEQIQQRECYYLYYEILPDGKIIQQIFCRGTTLTADVFTCLNCSFFYDSELGIRLHRGFRNHAHRLVEDLEPLLSNHKRSTVEICGHSLGGAVAMIVAAKLKKRGYNVTRVTGIATPRFVENNSASIETLLNLLPDDTLRIEDDLDGVPFLPPIGYTAVGHKLWFVKGKDGKHSTKFIPLNRNRISFDLGILCSRQQNYRWENSFIVNGRFIETALVISQTHRTRSYVSRIHELISEMEGNDDSN